jgi:hypothetical protein
MPISAGPARTIQAVAQRPFGRKDVYLGCGYGQGATVTFRVPTGFFWIVTEASSIAGGHKDVESNHDYCGYMSCIATGTQPSLGSGWKVDFIEEHTQYGDPTPLTENCD